MHQGVEAAAQWASGPWRLAGADSDLDAVATRELGITRVLQGETDKRAGFDRLLTDVGIAPMRRLP